ncbi:hypothetical protein ACH5RR_032511 [Cinchona calisaya]|uniref:Uncharacterized protein n=1 Tax=Cinchona calisaya TaxID=153742 RepID=A0ABD2YMF8_9GENT
MVQTLVNGDSLGLTLGELVLKPQHKNPKSYDKSLNGDKIFEPSLGTLKAAHNDGESVLPPINKDFHHLPGYWLGSPSLPSSHRWFSRKFLYCGKPSRIGEISKAMNELRMEDVDCSKPTRLHKLLIDDHHCMIRHPRKRIPLQLNNIFDSLTDIDSIMHPNLPRHEIMASLHSFLSELANMDFSVLGDDDYAIVALVTCRLCKQYSITYSMVTL